MFHPYYRMQTPYTFYSTKQTLNNYMMLIVKNQTKDGSSVAGDRTLQDDNY